MRLPSPRTKRYFWLPSDAGAVRSTTCGNASVNLSSSFARTSFGRLLIASNESTPRRCIHSAICLMRNGGETTSPSVLCSRAGARSWRLTRSLLVTGSRDRFDASRRAHFPRPIDAQGAQECEVVDVDAELNFLVALDDDLRRRFRLVLPVQSDGCVEHDVQVVAFVADPLDLLVDIVGPGDRFV